MSSTDPKRPGEDLVTPLGYVPDKSVLYFNITVQTIEEKINIALGTIISRYNQQVDAGEEVGPKIQPFKAKIGAVKCGYRFTVLSVVLPLSAAVNLTKQKKQVANELGMFSVGESGRSRVQLHPKVWKYFRMFMFSAENMKEMHTPRWQREEGIPTGEKNTILGYLDKFQSPRLLTNKHGDPEAISFNINLWAVLYQQLTYKDDDINPYTIDIEEVQKIADRNYRFRVRREYIKSKKGKKKKSSESQYIMNAMKHSK